MSSKASSSPKNTTKRRPQLESMVTRHKTAQSKRQLRIMDRSMKKITSLLKSPEKLHKSPEKPSKTAGNAVKPKSSLKTYGPSTKSRSISPGNTQKRTSPTNTPKSTIIKTYIPSPKLNSTKNPEAKVLSKSPKKLAEKEKQLPKQSEKKKAISENKEFHPNKMKRNSKSKKIILKPKHELTAIHSINKRKMTPPQKEIKSPVPCKRSKNIHKAESEPKPKTQKVQSKIELTVQESVKEDDTDSLTEEDLLEILTCPSPVWWEDPPDVGYSEDPIFKFPSDAWTREQKTPVKATETKYEEKIIAELEEKVVAKVGEVQNTCNAKESLIKSEEKFLEKRSVLENLLSNIKTKKVICLDSKKPNYNKTEAVSPLRKFRKPVKPNTTSQNTSPIGSNETDTFSKSKKQTISESSDFSDIRDDDILKDLENLVIPIEETGTNNSSSAAVHTPTEVIVLDDDPPERLTTNSCEPSTSILCDAVDTQAKPTSIIEDNLEVSMVEGMEAIVLPALVPKRNNHKGKVEKGKVQIMSQKTLLWSSKLGDEKTIHIVNDAVVKMQNESAVNQIEHQMDVPKDLPPLKKFPKVSESKIVYPCHSKNDSCDSDDITDSYSIVSSSEFDTISDTNIKFISDDEIIEDKKVNENKSERVLQTESSEQNKNMHEQKLLDDANNKSDSKIQFFLDDTIKKKIDKNNLGAKNSDTKSTKNIKSSIKESSAVSAVQNKQDSIKVYKIIKNKAIDANDKTISGGNKSLHQADVCKDINSTNDTTKENQSKDLDNQIVDHGMYSMNGSIHKNGNNKVTEPNKNVSITKSEINKTYKAMTVKLLEKENMIKDVEGAKRPVIVIKRRNIQSNQGTNKLLG